MPARVPLDVDLEDRLLYGLTPMRLGYVVVGMLAGFSIWSTHWSALPVRAAAAITTAAVGAAAAWGRWRGRALDSWLADIVMFVITTYRVRWSMPRRRQRARPG
jgi:PrgI family protein